MAHKNAKTIVLRGDYSETPTGIDVPSSLTMRPPRGKDQLQAQRMTDSDADMEAMLWASLCEVDPAVIGELEMVDYVELQTAYSHFIKGKHLGSQKKPAKPATS